MELDALNIRVFGVCPVCGEEIEDQTTYAQEAKDNVIKHINETHTDEEVATAILEQS